MTLLLRDLNYIQEEHQSHWAQSLKTVLKDALALNNGGGHDGLSASPHRDCLERSLQDLLQDQLPDSTQAGHQAPEKAAQDQPTYIVLFMVRSCSDPVFTGDKIEYD